tara:strand:+ start:225 stop:488 length:264 start_codon:yes stop_codon:yes gene_type:complete
MANIKSAKKRIVQTLKRTEINKFRKSRLRSGIKKISLLVEGKNKEETQKQFLKVESELAKAAGKGVLKKNTASRLVSRLSKKIKSLS